MGVGSERRLVTYRSYRGKPNTSSFVPHPFTGSDLVRSAFSLDDYTGCDDDLDLLGMLGNSPLRYFLGDVVDPQSKATSAFPYHKR
ncbi:hypothetical protein IAQ61_000706 [Plenodomus lingam]|uniref:uncharacterized protein n=1 Tax=Leptosphaeria maculans TaxID=5022 RepID=UPI003332625F|nr:hypothetical protein IAQ61_000706 [Plenodomus lingam]